MKTEIYAALRKWYYYQSGYSNFRFGYKEFRSRQYGLSFFYKFHVDAIRLILEGSDVVVLMPTGGMSLTSVLLHRREVPVLPNPSPRSKWALCRRFSSDRPHARPAYSNLSLPNLQSANSANATFPAPISPAPSPPPSIAASWLRSAPNPAATAFSTSRPSASSSPTSSLSSDPSRTAENSSLWPSMKRIASARCHNSRLFLQVGSRLPRRLPRFIGSAHGAAAHADYGAVRHSDGGNRGNRL